MVIVEVVMSRIDLTNNFHTSPTCWQNFFQHELALGPKHVRTGDITTQYINTKLRPYAGRWDSGNRHRSSGIWFKDDAHKMLFILRWS
jgi:hypothetical protein